MLKLNLALDVLFFSACFNRACCYLPLSALLGWSAALALAPSELWFMMPLALSGLLTLQAFFGRRHQVFITALVFFVSYNYCALDFLDYVMRDFGRLSAVTAAALILLLAAYLALPYALLQLLAFAGARRRVAVFVLFFTPVAFVGGDLCAYYLCGGFPWALVGYSALSGPLSAYAPLLGVQGINLVIYVLSASLALAVMRQFIFLPVAAVLLALGSVLMGVHYTSPGQERSAVLVQANIPPRLQWDESQAERIVTRHLELSRPYLERRNALIIWSESALPFYKEAVPGLIAALNEAYHAQDSVLITGIQSLDEQQRAYNSLIVLGQSADPRQLQVYHKRQLVPFGETVPLREYLAPLAPIFNFPMSSFTAGAPAQPNLIIGELQLISAICYEALFSALLVDSHQDASGAIVMLSNDGWFGSSRGPLLHLNIARMRTLELQKPMLRVTSSGVTALITAQGNVAQALPRDQAAVLEVNFTPHTGSTPYARFGNLPALLLSAALLLLGLYGRRRDPDPQRAALAHMVRP